MIHVRVRVCAASCWVGFWRIGEGVGVVVGVPPSVGVKPHLSIPLVALGGEGTAVDGELHKGRESAVISILLLNVRGERRVMRVSSELEGCM